MRSAIGTVCFMLLALPITAQAQTGIDQLLQGEVRYESLRGHHLDALLRYNSGLSSSRAQSSPVEAGITDARLALGLSDTVEQQLKGAPGGKDGQPSRNRSAYQLAWFYYNSRKPMQALEMLERIEAEAHERWPLEASLIVHRHGRLEPGARIVVLTEAQSSRIA